MQTKTHICMHMIMKLIFLCVYVMFSLGVEIPVAPPTTPSSITEEPSGEYSRKSNVYFIFPCIYLYAGAHPCKHVGAWGKDEENIVEVCINGCGIFQQFHASPQYFSTSVKTDCGINWIPHAFPLLIRGSWILNPLAATLGCASFNLSHFHN